MLATLVSEPFHRPGWIYKEKYDGDRVIAYRHECGVGLVSRNLKDVTAGFREIAHALERLPGGDLVLDGEVVAFDRDDVSRFQLLQRRAMGERIRPVFAMFDCLERDGANLIHRPLSERRQALETVVPRRRGVLMLIRRLRGDGFKAYRTARP